MDNVVIMKWTYCTGMGPEFLLLIPTFSTTDRFNLCPGYARITVLKMQALEVSYFRKVRSLIQGRIREWGGGGLVTQAGWLQSKLWMPRIPNSWPDSPAVFVTKKKQSCYLKTLICRFFYVDKQMIEWLETVKMYVSQRILC